MAKTCVESGSAPSSLVRLADGRIGLFYESRNHRDISLLRLPLPRILE